MASDSILATLRQDIDHVDDQLHELIVRRSRLVEKVREAKGIEAVDLLCPGREAEILRRLVAHHQGRFPKVALVRIWREILGAMVGLQGDFSVAVYMPERGAGYLELARDAYGSATPMTSLRSPGQVVRAVAEGSATIGVLPMPDREGIEPWWISLLGDKQDLPHIVGRLPFAPSEATEALEALTIGRVRVEPTGYDRSWLALETRPDISRGRLRSVLGAAGLEPTNLANTLRGEDNWLHLVEVAGAISAEDRRLARLVEGKDPVVRVVVVGGYPVPFSREDLSE